MTKYDLLILADEKDYNKVSVCIDQCRKHLQPAPTEIHVISPSLMNLGIEIKQHRDADVLPFTKDVINYRRQGWIWKMFVNLFQEVTPHQYYLVVDADLFFLKDIELFDEDGCPKFFISNRQNVHKPFLDCMTDLYDILPQVDYSFIIDFMMFDRYRLDWIMGNRGWTAESMLAHINDQLGPEYKFCDYDHYGHLTAKHFPQFLRTEHLHTNMYGHHNVDWPADKIRQLIEHNTGEYDLITTHTWL
jgi:hypothetical protein